MATVLRRISVVIAFSLSWLGCSGQLVFETTDTLSVTNLYFASGKFDLLPMHQRSLDSLYGSVPREMTALLWHLEAATDTVGSLQNNEKLAATRQQMVKEKLVNMGVPESQIRYRNSVVEEKPGKQGLAINRRVSVYVERHGFNCLSPIVPDSFCFFPGRDTSFMTRRGTVVMLKRDAFSPPANFTREACITIKVHEAYTRGDIILQGLQTATNDKPLESGGMVRLEATLDNKAVGLNPGQRVTYLVPAQNPDPKMTGWSYRNMEDGRANWVGGDVDMRGTLAALNDDCQDAIKAWMAGKRDMAYKTNRWLLCGGVRDKLWREACACKRICKFFMCKIKRTFKKLFSKKYRRALRTIAQLNKTRKPKEQEIPISAADELSLDQLNQLLSKSEEAKGLKDSIDRLKRQLSNLEAGPCVKQAKQRDSLLNALGFADQGTYLDSLWIGRETRGVETLKFGKSIPPEALQYYVLSSASLGWANIDQLLRYPESKRRDVLVAMKPVNGLRVFLTMENFSTVLAGRALPGGFRFTYIPMGEPFRIVAMSMLGNELQYGELRVEGITKFTEIPKLDMQPVSPKELLNRMRSLDAARP